jgi:hypothetical protein
MITAGVGRHSRVSDEEARARTNLVIGATKRPSSTASAYNGRSRRMSIKRLLMLTAIALAIVVLALAGWATRALRAAA